MEIRILLTGGGSGGHIVPLMAVVNKIQALSDPVSTKLDIRYFGDPGFYADELKANNISLTPVVSSKLRRYFDFRNFLDIFRFIWSLFEAFWKVYFFMPEVAFSKGGPGALAVLTACRFYRIPIVIHESDVVPGITNSVSGKSARLIEIAFASARANFPKKAHVNVVGLPIRNDIFSQANPEDSRKLFKLTSALPTILFLGGSQGAEKINNFIIENLLHLLPKYQIIHQVGPRNYERYKNEYQFVAEKIPPELQAHYFFAPYFGAELKDALNAADFVVSRAGASSIFELAAVGKPAILIPITGSPNDHQRQNAYEYERAGAGVVLMEENFLLNLLMITIDNVLKDPEKRAKMSEAAKKFFIPNAAENIARDILDVAAGK